MTGFAVDNRVVVYVRRGLLSGVVKVSLLLLLANNPEVRKNETIRL
jgi:hypothetical protein